ncbi:MAG: endonuclease III [Deltaproteobacteria bacterium]|nr:endonuclease III [Deltaproteobacteria bacterium]
MRRENLNEKGRRTRAIASRLAHAYPDIRVPLRHRNIFELLVATILSAQCTDNRVNAVTPELFQRFPTAAKIAAAPVEELERIIRPLGLFRAKGRSLKHCAKQLMERHGGKVPSTMDELTRLPGVGRKTANVILGYAFGVPAIVVDTHCRRLSRRLGIAKNEDPNKIENELRRLLPAEEWLGFSHRLIIHGRRICQAQKPKCEECVVNDLCPSSRVSSTEAATQDPRS